MLDHLPWRVRRRAEALVLGSQRFRKGLDTLPVRSATSVATLVAVGDVAVTDTVLEAVGRIGRADEWRTDIQAIFGDADIRTCNLESIITNSARQRPLLGATMKSPVAALDLLCAARFDAVTLANNHARDCGLDGLIECCRLLDEAGIRHCGAGPTPEMSRAPAIHTTSGICVGMLGYCDNYSVDPDPSENVAPALADDNDVLNDIAVLRQKVEIVVVQLHWGWEFALHPLLSYRDRARKFAEAGADLVLCHHAHVPMGVERWGSSVIAHGLGNFVFPRDPYLSAGHPWSYRTFALKAAFDHQGITTAELVPCILDQDGLPRRAQGVEAREILGGLARASRRLYDDSFLKKVELDRTLRDALAIAKRLALVDTPQAAEWSLALQSPFRRDCIERLHREFGNSGAELANFLRALSYSYADPIRMSSLLESARNGQLQPVIDALLATKRLPDEPVGRLP